MMSPAKAFSYYHGLHLHFSSDTYSLLKYGPDTENARKRFTSLTPPQKSRFSWAANQFQTTQDLVYACIGCELADVDLRFSDKQSILDSYYNYKSRRESIEYVLKNDLEKYEVKNETKFHQLLFNYFAGQYCPEFVLILDHDHGNLNKVLDNRSFTFARNKILKLIKYKDFFSSSKYQYLLHHEEHLPA